MKLIDIFLKMKINEFCRTRADAVYGQRLINLTRPDDRKGLKHEKTGDHQDENSNQGQDPESVGGFFLHKRASNLN